MSRLAAAFLLLAAPVAFAQKPADKPGTTPAIPATKAAAAPASMSAEEAELRKGAEEFDAAWAKADVKALLAMYADDAVIHTASGDAIKGKAAIEKMMAEGIERMKGGTPN